MALLFLLLSDQCGDDPERTVVDKSKTFLKMETPGLNFFAELNLGESHVSTRRLVTQT